jgi:hypothetical protein
MGKGKGSRTGDAPTAVEEMFRSGSSVLAAERTLQLRFTRMHGCSRLGTFLLPLRRLRLRIVSERLVRVGRKRVDLGASLLLVLARANDSELRRREE